MARVTLKVKYEKNEILDGKRHPALGVEVEGRFKPEHALTIELLCMVENPDVVLAVRALLEAEKAKRAERKPLPV